MGTVAAIGGIASLVGSKMASDSAEKSAKDASNLTRQQMARLDAIDLPDEEKMRLLLENPELMGLLEAEGIDPSKLGEISLDPQLREKQMAALESLQTQADEGLTATDKYSMEQMLGDVSAQQRSQQAGIESEMARRGMDSSGAALMAKLQAGQSGANTARDKAMQMAAQGQQNRMAALGQLGAQSGQMQQQEFGRQAQVASAQDAIARANAMNRQSVSGQNLAARQAIENQRANLSNQQQMYNKGLEQQRFENELKKAGQQGTASQHAATAASNVAQSQAKAGADMWKTAAGLGSSYMQYGQEDGGVVKAADGGVMSRESMPVQNQQAMIDEENRQKEAKQHEKFKKDYMKRVRSELNPAAEEARQEVTGEGPAKASNGGLIKPAEEARQEVTRTGTARAQDGALLEDVTRPSELTPEGTDFESPDARKSAIMAALMSQMQNMDPEQNVPMRREDGGILNRPSEEELKVATDYLKQPNINESELDPTGILRRVSGRTMVETTDDDGNTRYREAEQGIGAGREVGIPLPFQEELGLAQLKNYMSNMKSNNEYANGGPVYASNGTGEIIDSGMGSFAGDRVDAKVNDGEIIINAPQQQRLMDLLRGEISVDELGTDDIVEGVPRDFRDDMHEELEAESEEVSGIKKLLEMLGE